MHATRAVQEVGAVLMGPWRDLALDLPRYHDSLAIGQPEPFLARLSSLPPVDPAGMDTLPDATARLAALDVLMVDAVVRRHRLRLPVDVAGRLETARTVVADRLGIRPILSYPLYIRANPLDPDKIRRFTPTDAELRFIRMHRLIEDTFEHVIETLDAVLGAPEPAAALAGAFDGLGRDFRLANRTVAGFRSEDRIPRATFNEGFRPYFGSILDPETGATIMEGPSGLQSPTFRTVAMLVGYRDPLLDGWTERIGAYHEPATREGLRRVRQARDGGRSLTSIADAILGPTAPLPHLHPGHGADAPALLDLARRGRFVSPGIEAELALHGLALGQWPPGAPAPGPMPAVDAPPTLAAEDLSVLAWLAEIEAMFFGFHLEHVATTAAQIGSVRGTGGTSGVEFLLLATFRRGFPRLWRSGLGARLAGGL